MEFPLTPSSRAHNGKAMGNQREVMNGDTNDSSTKLFRRRARWIPRGTDDARAGACPGDGDACDLGGLVALGGEGVRLYAKNEGGQ